MSMHVNLSPEMEGFIKTKVSSGFYGSATEVIRDALRRMQAEEQRAVAWQSAIAVGSAQLDRGESVDYTAATLDGMTRAARKAMHSCEPMDPDVLP